MATKAFRWIKAVLYSKEHIICVISFYKTEAKKKDSFKINKVSNPNW